MGRNKQLRKPTAKAEATLKKLKKNGQLTVVFTKNLICCPCELSEAKATPRAHGTFRTSLAFERYVGIDEKGLIGRIEGNSVYIGSQYHCYAKCGKTIYNFKKSR